MSETFRRAAGADCRQFNRRTRVRLAVAALLSAGAAALIAPTAQAQSTTPAPAEDAGSLQEVVVTAQFRRQNLQDTPIAMTAVTAETLQERNQTNLADVTNQAPNVVLKETGGAFGPGMSAYIRGTARGTSIRPWSRVSVSMSMTCTTPASRAPILICWIWTG